MKFMKNVAVIGAGTMGNGIAQVVAGCGTKVVMVDISQASLDKAMATISKSLDRFVKKEKSDYQHKREACCSACGC